ncbi:MAG: hypothetical protein HY291_17240 [Planctomycetes bacterium]|nr:hypothetical protein [Planctomycetota bacterium]
MKLDQIDGKLLNRAIDIYWAHAYRRKADSKRQAPKFPEDENLPKILTGKHPFEDLSGGPQSVPIQGGALPRVFALRLGNDAYPHMKVALVESYFHDEFVFSVDRHDTFHFEPDVPGYDAWCELKEINRILKEAIEDAWHKAGIPTLRSLREQRFKRTELVRNLRADGQSIMILDDDESRAAILKGILENVGFAVIVGPPGPKPNPDETVVREVMRNTPAGVSLRLPAEACQNAGDVKDLCELAVAHRVMLFVLDVSYRTGQGPRVASALRLNSVTQEVPILAIYSRRDFGPDPDLFDVALRRPYRAEALQALIEQTLFRRPGGSGLHRAVKG